MDWTRIIATAATAAAVTVLMSLWLRACTRDPVFRDGVVVLRYPKSRRAFLGLGSLFFLALLVGLVWAVIDDPSDPKALRVAWVGVPFAALFAFACWREGRVRLELDGDGIRGRTAFRGRRAVSWAGLDSVT